MWEHRESITKVFHMLPQRDVMTWTAMIVGLAMCGKGEKALEVFMKCKRMGLSQMLLLLLVS